MSLYPDQLKNHWFVSMEGLKRTVVFDTLTNAAKYLKENEDYELNSITFCTDNDEAAIKFAEKYVDAFALKHSTGKRNIQAHHPKYTKDWNDELKYLKQIDNMEKQIIKNQENVKENTKEYKESVHHNNRILITENFDTSKFNDFILDEESTEYVRDDYYINTIEYYMEDIGKQTGKLIDIDNVFLVYQANVNEFHGFEVTGGLFLLDKEVSESIYEVPEGLFKQILEVYELEIPDEIIEYKHFISKSELLLE